MTIKKFADGAAFVAIDLEGADRSVGIVRQARKILQGGANDLARSLTYTFATHVFLFVIFGAFLVRSGVGKFFVELPYALLGRSPGGAGKVAVLASALLGSVTGSPTANTVATGTFTIPLMKRTGYAPSVAAANPSKAAVASDTTAISRAAERCVERLRTSRNESR